MGRTYAILFCLILLFGCAAQAPADLATAEEFCHTLQTSAAQKVCMDYADRFEDDPRMRGLYLKLDVLLSDLADIRGCMSEADENVVRINEATEPAGLKEIYLDYYAQARSCSSKIGAANKNLNEFQFFLAQNKEYLDSRGIDTAGSMESILGVRSEYLSYVKLMQENFGEAGDSITLTEQERQDVDALLLDLSKMAVELG